MESSKLGYWLQVGANIGLLAGLILVGFQIQQNSQILRTQVITEEADEPLIRSGYMWVKTARVFGQSRYPTRLI